MLFQRNTIMLTKSSCCYVNLMYLRQSMYNYRQITLIICQNCLFTIVEIVHFQCKRQRMTS